MTHLAFDQNSKVVFASSTKLEVSVAGSTITWATLDEEYDALYAYTHSDGVATKGDLLAVDVDEEMGRLAQNQIMYRSAVELLNRKIGTLKYAISAGSR